MKRNFRHAMFLVTLSAAALAGCGSSVTGSYVDAEGSGAFTLELKPGGAATFTFNGMPLMCNYTTSGTTVSLTCPGQTGALVLTVQKDGSLTPPSGTLMPSFKKK